MDKSWPPMPLYPANIVADTMGLDCAETGALLLLFGHIWMTENCRIKEDERHFQFILKVSANKWPRVRQLIAPYFTIKRGWWSPEGAMAWRMADWTMHPCRSAGSRWREIRKMVLLRDGYTCQYCGCTNGPFDVDHVMPRSRGGTNDYKNLVAACQTCNRSKNDKTPAEWQGVRRGSN